MAAVYTQEYVTLSKIRAGCIVESRTPLHLPRSAALGIEIHSVPNNTISSFVLPPLSIKSALGCWMTGDGLRTVLLYEVSTEKNSRTPTSQLSSLRARASALNNTTFHRLSVTRWHHAKPCTEIQSYSLTVSRNIKKNPSPEP